SAQTTTSSAASILSLLDALPISRQIRYQPVARGETVAFAVVVQKLDLHARHVDAGRAFALAALARDAQRHRLAHVFRNQRLRAEDRKSTRLNSSHDQISYAVFCL